MSEPITHYQTSQALETIGRVLANFERDERELLRRAREARPDGLPPGRGLDEQTGGGSGDPTGTAAIERADPERPDAAGEALRLLLAAASACGRADRAREPALPPVKRHRGTDGCRSCARYVDAAGKPYFSPVFRCELCRRCYGLVRDKELNPHALMPPIELLELLSRGSSWTVTVVERSLAAEWKSELARRAQAR